MLAPGFQGTAMRTGPVGDLDSDANVLVTGASRGIGLAAVTQLLDTPGVGTVLAVARQAGRSPELVALAGRDARLQLHDVDLADAAAIEAFGRQASASPGRLHLWLNCAGMLHADGVRPEKALSQVGIDALQRVFALNAFAPILLARALQPAFRHGQPAVLASISARVGSIGDNALGGWYAYRASKAAQNQLWKTLSVEMRRINPAAACVLLHPGTVDTALSSPFKAGVPEGKLFTPERAARQLLDIIAGLHAGDSGRFIAWDGTDIPW